MIIFSRLQDTFNTLDEKKIRNYMVVFFIGFLVFVGAGWFYARSSISALKKKLNNLNEMRETVKEILDKSKQVELQRANVNSMLAENPTFKIGGYFTSIVEKLKLNDKSAIETPVITELDNEYTESSLQVKLVNLNMKQLTELLKEIKQTPRIYTKNLEITRSQKAPDAIDATLTIATLRPKLETE